MQVHLQFYSECSRNSRCKWSGSPSFTVQSYEIGIPVYSEFDMLQREKDKRLIFFNDNDNVDENLVNQI